MIGNTGVGIEETPYQSAILDANGTIVSVNEAWRTFAEQNGGNAAVRAGVGLNYLDVCRKARGINSDEAQVALISLERVLVGAKAAVSFQYPCHSPSEQRWFLCASSLVEDEFRGVLVAHIFVGEQRAARRRGADGESKLDTENAFSQDDARILRRELLLYQHVQEMTATGGWELDLSNGEMRWTPETYQIYEVFPDTFTPTAVSIMRFYNKRGRDILRLALLKAEQFGVPFDFELPVVSAGRHRIHVRITGRPEMLGVRPWRLYGVVQDVTDRYDLVRRLTGSQGSGDR